MMLGYKGLRALGLITESKGVTCFISIRTPLSFFGLVNMKSKAESMLAIFIAALLIRKNNTSLTEVLKMTGVIYH